MRHLAYPLLVVTLTIPPVPLLAQQEDEGGGSMLERFLQDTLSGDDQNVRVVGLQGALSARATIQEITVADDEGIWLTIKDAQLDWNRLALIRGRFSVNALTAQQIDIARAPGTTSKEAPPPSAETTPFQLPELPVAIEIGELRVDELSLGEPLIGVAADLEVNGNLSLTDGSLETALQIDRTDRAGDAISLKAGFQNATSQIDLDLSVTEAAGGLIATALQIPDAPPVQLTAKGSGPLTDFTADIGLSSDNQQRVGGQVRLRAAPPAAQTSADGIAFTADLSGDLTPFVTQDLDPFFGTDTQLFIDGRTHSDGALDVSEFTLSSNALNLKGELHLDPGASLQMAALQGRIASPDSGPVVLPVPGGSTSIETAQISALFDQKNGNLWNLSLTTNGVKADQVDVDRARITAQGTLAQADGFQVDGDLQAALDGLEFSDQSLSTAIGNRITLDGLFTYGSDQSLTLSEFELIGSDYSAALDAVIDGLTSGLQVTGAASVDATDLSRFSDIAKLDLAGRASVKVDGSGSPLEQTFDGTVEVQGTGLETGRDDIDPVIQGDTRITLDGERGADGIEIRDFAIISDAVRARANGTVTTPDNNLRIDGQATVSSRDLSVFSGLAKRDLAGSVQAKIDGAGTVQTLEFDGTAELSGRDLQVGLADIDPLLNGPVSVEFDGSRSADQIVIRSAKVNGKAVTAEVTATVDDPTGAVAFEGQADLDIPDLSLFSSLAGLELAGSVQASAKGSGSEESKQFNIQGDVDANGLQTGIELADKLIQGQTTLTIDALNDEQGLNIRTFRLRGSAITADASGQLDRASGGLDFSVALDDVARIVPDMSGPLQLDGNVAPTNNGVEGKIGLKGPESSYANLDGHVDSDGSADFDFDAKFNRIERFIPDFPGSLNATGTAKREAGLWTIDTQAQGPADINSTLSGTFDEATSMADLTAQGGLNIGIANFFISPNKIEGSARFDLALKGQPSLEALSGSITTSGTSLAIPSVGQTITGIGGSVDLGQSRATIALNGGVRAGGGFTVSGPVDLTPPFNAQITTALNGLVFTDTRLYETILNGQIALTGALAGDSTVAGQITFGETNINLAAATGAVGAAPIPEIEHLNEPTASFLTRERAHLVATPETTQSDSRISLDVSLLAPKAVFVRGRGVNAELGGEIRIGGTTTSVIPSGQIELIRGNFDILGRRLALTKGIVSLQGDLTPFIEFESTASTSEGTATIEIAGPLDSPEVNVFSDPERPAEEALAILLFGNRFSQLSPLVIAQMAASLAQLSGAGGDATKGLRDSTGVDTVDIGATSSGAGRLGAGAYLSDNLYTDFTVNTEGDTEVNLNLDVTDNFTVRGSVDGRGDTGVGVFFERDY